MTLDKLRELLVTTFGPPFLPEGHVRAEWAKAYPDQTVLSVHIGRRDVWIDENGDKLGAGTMLVGDVPEGVMRR